MSNVVFSNVHLNFSFDSDSLFSRIETILYQWAKKDLSDVFDKVFEDRDVDDADLHLENVDFDLGDVPEGFFLSETCSRLKEKLEQLLYPKIENQRKSICLKILLNSCKKFAPGIEASQVEENFSIVYRAEDSKETIFKNVISILQKNHPDLSFDEMTQDVLNELIFVKSKKDNIYLLNVLEKIYFSFFQEQEESFIQSFLTSTVPHYFSDGYLDLLKHFVLEMQEKYPNLNNIQNSKNLFFEALENKNNADLNQIFSDICASVLPGNSSKFIDEFIRRTKETFPAITILGIVILFIDELKQKYPQLNDFRLSNFNEDKLSNLSKIYWKNEIKEILWDIYKPILLAEPGNSENSISEEGKQDQESASVSEEAQDKAENLNAEKSETAESDNSKDSDSNVSDTDVSDSNASESKAAESETLDSESLDNEFNSGKNKLPESIDSENSVSKDDKLNQKSTSVSDDAQDKAENLNAEKSETAESDDASDDASESKTAESKAAENEFSESEDLESKSSSDKNKLPESTDSENSVSKDDKLNQKSTSVSDDAQDKAEEFNAEKSETTESDGSKNSDSNVSDTDVPESSVSENKVAESDVAESETLDGESTKNQSAESRDSQKATFEDEKRNRENANISDDAQDKTEKFNAEKSETAESDNSKDSDFNVSDTDVSDSSASESKLAESETLDSKFTNNKKQLPESTDSGKNTSADEKQNRKNASISGDAQNKAEDFNAEKSETAESDDASDDASGNGTSDSNVAESKATKSEVSENGANKQSQFKANTTQVQTSEAFDKIFNECFAESSSPEKNTSPLQVTESFISKLQKEFPDKAAPASAIKAYQKATELEMKYNSTVDDKNEIVVKDAGLVLIGAYVPMLFKKLEYIADGAFISEQTRLKACSLLRYIVFGDLPSDGLHFLGNYFCGLPWNFRIPKEIVLDENEKNIAESLIKSVIDNWKAIGHVSIDGFRGTFLHRDGKIEKEMDEEIHLKVKQGPFDMLLDKLPWSYSMLKFKWHKKLLTTTWR